LGIYLLLILIYCQGIASETICLVYGVRTTEKQQVEIPEIYNNTHHPIDNNLREEDIWTR